uniref:C1q domain-containing protein n=1 Tax=Pomacea canaliculata TaxID=400727 RepID=J7I6L2_POMCA|nr:C1q domain-containing protein [Pomacea canaliculata]
MAIIFLALLMSMVSMVSTVPISDAQAIDIYEAIQELNRTVASLQQRYYFMATFNEQTVLAAGVAKFDKVLSDELGLYDEGSGKFTAPRSGLYLLTAQILIKGTGHASLELQLNSNLLAVWNIGSGKDLSGQIVYPVLLKKDDTVHVVSRGKVSIYGGNHSFFSGYLIK